MPSDAKGTRAFHGQLVIQAQGTTGSASTVASSQTATAIGEQDHDKQGDDHREDVSGSGNKGQARSDGGVENAVGSAVVGGAGDDNHDGSDNGLGNDLPPTSAPPSPSVAASRGKRRFSAMDSTSGGDSDISDLTTPLQNASSTSSHMSSASASLSKRGRVSGAVALASLGHSLTGFTSVFRQGIEMEQARHNARVARRDTHNASTSSSSQAMDKAQTVELDLSPDELAALLEILEEESAANAYMQIRRDDLRVAWVKRKLAGAGVV